MAILLRRFILAALLCPLASLWAAPQVPPTGRSPNDFVPRGWSILAKAEGDLNRDGKADVALVLRSAAEDREQNEEVSRLLVLLLKTAKGYSLSAVSEKVIFCKNCGGTFGDPFQTIKIDRGSVLINQTGGSREVWNMTFRFRLQKEGKGEDWFLIGWTSESYDRVTGESANRDFNLLTGDVIITEQRLDRQEGKDEDEGKLLPATTARSKRKPLLLKLKDFNPEQDLLASEQ